MLHLRRTLVYTLHYEQLHNCINPIRVTESELHRCLLSNAQVPSNVSLAASEYRRCKFDKALEASKSKITRDEGFSKTYRHPKPIENSQDGLSAKKKKK